MEKIDSSGEIPADRVVQVWGSEPRGKLVTCNPISFFLEADGVAASVADGLALGISEELSDLFSEEVNFGFLEKFEEIGNGDRR